MFTKVFNLATGEEQESLLTPEQAVVAAYEGANNNYNTWEYDWTKAQISNSGLTVVCGDWSAVRIVHHASLDSDRNAICGEPLKGEMDVPLKTPHTADKRKVTCHSCRIRLAECYLISGIDIYENM